MSRCETVNNRIAESAYRKDLHRFSRSHPGKGQSGSRRLTKHLGQARSPQHLQDLPTPSSLHPIFPYKTHLPNTSNQRTLPLPPHTVMARTATFIYPPRHQATASWNQLEDSTLGPTLSTDAQDIALCSLTEDDSELIMMPVLRHFPEDVGEIDDWRVCEDGAPYKCWKSTAIYLKIGRDHPRLVR